MEEQLSKHEQSLVHQMENWGYYLLPRPHPYCPGYTGLLIAIREKPTQAHFDPELIRLYIRGEDGLAERVTLRLESPIRSRDVCPGRVILLDRKEKRVDFFTFGGSLEVASTPGERVYSLRSPAPIMEISNFEVGLADDLVFEIEAMIGEVRARWGEDEEGFAWRIAHVDPLQLYIASLHSIFMRYEQAPTLLKDLPGFYDMLLEERRCLAAGGQWPEHPPTLEELLAPGSGGRPAPGARR